MGWSLFDDEHSKRERQRFADQFEPAGRDFLYWKSLKGPPVRVSPTERDRFVESYNRAQRHSTWMMFGALIVSVIAFVVYGIQSGADISKNDGSLDWIFVAGMLSIAAVFIEARMWAWQAPSRELRGRGTEGVARTRAETRRIMLRKTRYGQLIAGVGFVAVGLFRLSVKTDLFSGWNRLWLVFAAAVVIMAAASAYLKWRFESSKSDS